jgi:hypothetical protein
LHRVRQVVAGESHDVRAVREGSHSTSDLEDRNPQAAGHQLDLPPGRGDRLFGSR